MLRAPDYPCSQSGRDPVEADRVEIDKGKTVGRRFFIVVPAAMIEAESSASSWERSIKEVGDSESFRRKLEEFDYL